VGVRWAACRRPLTWPPAPPQLSMLFTEECDRVRDLMHVHSFSYDFHLRLVHQHVLGAHLALRHGYQLTTFLRHFLAHHPDGPHFGRNHIYQGQCPRASQGARKRTGREPGPKGPLRGPDLVSCPPSPVSSVALRHLDPVLTFLS